MSFIRKRNPGYLEGKELTAFRSQEEQSSMEIAIESPARSDNI